MNLPQITNEPFARTEGEPAPMSITDVSNVADGSLLRVEDVALRLRIGRTKVFELLKDGELESVPIGRLRRIPSECVTEYINRLRKAARANSSAA